MDKTKIKYFLIDKLVENSQYVTMKYCEFKNETIGENPSALKKVSKIIKLNWEHWILRKEMNSSVPKNYKCVHKEGFYPEYKRLKRETWNELFDKIQKYDVISFDIFDTLVFRAVEKPTDVFRILEGKWNIIGFADMRRQVEKELRREKQELNIYDIYEKLSKKYGISVEEGVQKELDIEKKICHANPYMKQVVEKLYENNKQIIAVSDMYIPQKYMKELLETCGLTMIDQIFVSCDCGVGKGGGKLQEYVKSQIGQEKNIVHIGDSLHADVQGSKKAGWNAIHYSNISALGEPYRSKNMESLATSFYKGIVNEKMHSGVYNKDSLYEFGYVYGGILVQGYCQYLEQLAKQENLDLFLFVARDGDILNQASKLRGFPVDYEYIPFSRFASYQLTMERYIEEFINNSIVTRLRVTNATIQTTLEEVDLGYLADMLEENGLQKDELLSGDNYEKVCDLIWKYKDVVLTHCEETKKAAEIYFKKVIGQHKNICVVDIGWAGTGYFCLKYFLEDVLCMPINIYGALLGAKDTTSISNASLSGNMFYYLFGPNKNKTMMEYHFFGYGNSRFFCNVLEIMFSADQPSFLKFDLEQDEKVCFRYANSENNTEMICKIQQGILDFIKEYSKYEKIFPEYTRIPGQEAYEPIAEFMRDYKYCVELLGDYHINPMSGIFDDDRSTSFREVVKQLKLH